MSPIDLDIFNNGEDDRDTESTTYTGYVFKDTPSLSSKMSVILPDWDEETALDCEWMPRGATLPLEDARVLVIFANDEEPYVVWWKN